jgi:hypothetical protein
VAVPLGARGTASSRGQTLWIGLLERSSRSPGALQKPWERTAPGAGPTGRPEAVVAGQVAPRCVSSSSVADAAAPAIHEHHRQCGAEAASGDGVPEAPGRRSRASGVAHAPGTARPPEPAGGPAREPIGPPRRGRGGIVAPSTQRWLLESFSRRRSAGQDPWSASSAPGATEAGQTAEGRGGRTLWRDRREEDAEMQKGPGESTGAFLGVAVPTISRAAPADGHRRKDGRRG